MIRKTHWRRDKAPTPLPKHIVFIQRDPRDVAVSAMFYRKLKPNDQSLMAVLRTMNTGKPEPGIPHKGNYVRWIEGWLEEPVLKVTYEQLHKRPHLALLYLYQGITGKATSERHITEVVRRQAFGRHKAKYPGSMRKGKMGDWKNYFKEEHLQYLEGAMGEFMRKQGYEI